MLPPKQRTVVRLVGQLDQRKNVHVAKARTTVQKSAKRRIGRITRRFVGILATPLNYFVIESGHHPIWLVNSKFLICTFVVTAKLKEYLVGCRFICSSEIL